MTAWSRERVHVALQHREPDKVPIDNNGIVSSIHEVAYENLLRYLGIEEKPVILDAVQRIVLSSEEVLQALSVDTRYLYPAAPSGWTYEEDGEGCWKDEFGVTYKRVGFYADCFRPALRGADLAAVKAYRFPDPTDPSRFRGLRDKALALHRGTDYALVSGAMLCFDYIRWILRGLEDAVADLYTEPQLAEYLLDAAVDWMTAYGQAIMAEIGDLIEFFWVGDDWGAQGGPFWPRAVSQGLQAAHREAHRRHQAEDECKVRLPLLRRGVLGDPRPHRGGRRHPAPAAAQCAG